MTITIRGCEYNAKGQKYTLIHVLKSDARHAPELAWFMLQKYARLGVLELSATIV